MRPGWNPTRRNRKIGTKAQGYGQNNSLVIPSSHHKASSFWESLKDYVVVRRTIGEKVQHFFIEPIHREGWFYPCTVDDVGKLLTKIQPVALEVFDFVVFRQPTRKQEVLSSVWGRARFEFVLDHYSGSAIVLEARSLEPYTWSKSLNPENASELERLRNDGHQIEIRKRDILIKPSVESLRNTVLYRTLLHEIGHHVDYQLSSDEEWNSKITREKEDMAHRFASEMYESLQQRNCVPFNQTFDLDQMGKDQLNPQWFLPPSAI
jgi:hypothetical protein